MALTLTYGGVTLELNSDLRWIDEHSWNPITQSIERSVNGNLLIDYGQKIGGRDITLQPADEDSGWIKRSTLETLEAWAKVAGREMVLGMNGTSYQVIFRQIDGAIEASPVVFYSDKSPDDWFAVALRFLEI